MTMELKDLTQEFFNELGDLVDFRKHPEKKGDMTWNCKHNHDQTKQVCEKLGLPWDEVLEILKNTGGYCDCEVLWNTYTKWKGGRTPAKK
jgi:hypothetical protein